jgi:hypothetical protein
MFFFCIFLLTSQLGMAIKRTEHENGLSSTVTECNEWSFYSRDREIEKSDYYLRPVRLSVRPSAHSHGTTRFPQKGL